jgi:hypothetical protein
MEFLIAAGAVLALSVSLENAQKCDAGILAGVVTDDVAYEYLDNYHAAHQRIWKLTQYVNEQTESNDAESYSKYIRSQLAWNYNVSQDTSLASDQNCIDVINFAKAED